MQKISVVLGLLLFTPYGSASVPLPVELGGITSLPLDMGGIAAIATVSLVLGTQLIKRR